MLAILQSADGILNSADRLTLAGALVVAVWALWRELAKKDALLVKATETITAAAMATTKSNEELRRVIEESVAAKRELAIAVEELRISIGALPCVTEPLAQVHPAPRPGNRTP